MYTLEFSGERGSERYEICTQSLFFSGRAVPTESWDDMVALLKKLKGAGKLSGKTEGGVPLYELSGDRSVGLERSEFKLLQDQINQPIWRPHVLEQVVEVKKWLSALKEDAPKLAKVADESFPAAQ